jgi:SutA RNAP-binding domain
VKKPVSKADLRADLERATEAFLQQGGEVKSIPQGTSGTDPGGKPPYLSRRLFVEPRATRTLVPEVVAAIEERRKALLKRTPKPKRSRLPRPRRKTIYDDFGEPLRRVWIEE